jgi:hypothetical protein
MQEGMKLREALIAFACILDSAQLAPAERCERLFALRRSSNRNEVVYEACFRRGAPDPDRPVRAHWRMTESDGHREELTALEERFAYGVAVRRNAGGDVTFSLRAAPDRALWLEGAGDEARAVVEIGGEACALLDVYVALGTGGLFPSVRYVLLGGASLATGALVSERIEP